MNNDVIIRAEGLGKKYVIGHSEREHYVALRDVIARTAKGFAQSVTDVIRGQASVTGDTREEFWALKDVSFEVKRGEVVGIIGRNGAGKSTLLKILSRITEPSEGRVTMKGRVASLLEVGTGFHPELTGYENIYLNGAILGMTHAEIRRKFDEIVAFAEVEKFLDTPVKRYSSGMYVRLAFALAAHLEPEILILDEVLAVGDAQFQKKCLNQMATVTSNGRTVLFVSHNMGAVKRICSTSIVLSSGTLQFRGETAEAIHRYSAGMTEDASISRALGPDLTIERLSVGRRGIESGRPVPYEIVLRTLRDTEVMDLSILIEGPTGERVAIIDCRTAEYPVSLQKDTCISFSGILRALPLVDGKYDLGLFVQSRYARGDVRGLSELIVSEPMSQGFPVPYPAEHRGFVTLEHEPRPPKIIRDASLGRNTQIIPASA